MSGVERFISFVGNLISIVGFVLAALKIFNVSDISIPIDERYGNLLLFAYGLAGPFAFCSFLNGMRLSGKPTFLLALFSAGAFGMIFLWLADQIGVPPETRNPRAAIAVMLSALIYYFRYYLPLVGFREDEGVLATMFSPKRGAKSSFFLLAHAGVGLGVLYILGGLPANLAA